MISDNQSICPKCGGQLKYYDHVQRLVRTKFGNKKWVAIRRLRCCKCHAVHRELPDFIFPYKQYRWKATTVAPTEAKAKSNLAYRYKKENGLMPNTKITLPGKLIPA